MFLAPVPAQVELVKASAAAVDPKPVVLFNPAWSFDEEEGEAFGAGARSFLGSFSVVYSFTGLEVRRVLKSDRTGLTAALRYRFTGPVRPVTGGNRLNSNPNLKLHV